MNISPKTTAIVLTSLTGTGIEYYYMAVVFRDDMYRVIGGASVLLMEIVVFSVIAVLLMIFEKTRQAGKGVIIGALITLVIGFGICSAF